MWSQALGRAPAGRLPGARRAAKGEAARVAAEIQLGCNIEASAAQLLQLLFEVGPAGVVGTVQPPLPPGTAVPLTVH